MWLFRATEKASLLLSWAVRGQGNPDTVKPWIARLLQNALGSALQIDIGKAAQSDCSCQGRFGSCSAVAHPFLHLDFLACVKCQMQALQHYAQGHTLPSAWGWNNVLLVLHVSGLASGHTAIAVPSCPRAELLSCSSCGFFALCIPCF